MKSTSKKSETKAGKKSAREFVSTIFGEKVPAEDVAHITPKLRILAVRVDSLQRDPRNARGHDQRNLTAIANSLKEFGQQKPVIFGDDRIMVAGSGTHEAAESLGWKYLAGIPTDLNGKRAEAFGIADNRTNELSHWLTDLESKVAEIRADGIGLESMGFTDSELAEVLQEAEKLAGSAAPEASGSGSGGGEQVLDGKFMVVYTCRDEAHQTAVLEASEGDGKRLGALLKGAPCRALMS